MGEYPRQVSSPVLQNEDQSDGSEHLLVGILASLLHCVQSRTPLSEEKLRNSLKTFITLVSKSLISGKWLAAQGVSFAAVQLHSGSSIAALWASFALFVILPNGREWLGRALHLG